MTRLLLALLLLGLGAPDPVLSGVRRWRDAPVHRSANREERPLLSGSTTDLSYLEVHATTLSARRGAELLPIRHDTNEVMLIVQKGQLEVRMPGAHKTVGPGSLVLSLPGDSLVVSNAGQTSATFYLFTYHSKAPVNLERGRKAGGSFILDWYDVPATKTAVGSRRQSFDRATAMFSRFEVHVSTVNPGRTNHATHTHRAEEFVLFRKGVSEMVIDGPGHEAGEGDLVFLASNVPHSLVNVGRRQTEYFAIQGY